VPDLPSDQSEPKANDRRESLGKEPYGEAQPEGIDRRTLLKQGLIAGGLLATGGGAAAALSGCGASGTGATVASDPDPLRRASRVVRPPGSPEPPNVLVVMVDQMRTSPHWIPNARVLPADLPNLTRLSRESVCFESHYTASNDCSPARSTLLTGLYTHQTGCMITGGSTLARGFPTWGTLLREQGYNTYWYGKWHLTHGDNKWHVPHHAHALEPYGFTGGTYPSPDGGPGQGTTVDPYVVDQFAEWFALEGEAEPWCTTVSLVNPHDIAWWYKWTNKVPPEWESPQVTLRLPPNFETSEQVLQGKPRLQVSLQDTAAVSFGPIPYEGPNVTEAWLPFLDLYAMLQRKVDRQVGRVLRILESNPRVAAKTVVVFTSDHGEYGASHGMRGKGASAYEEAIRVPLLVKDPRGVLTKAIRVPRRQLTSSVDVAPLLLTIATGSDRWRREPFYEHLAGRADLARLLADPRVPGRPYILHATDEIVTEYAIETYASDAPLHVTAIRTPTAKFASYANWSPGSVKPITSGEENELYDLTTRSGRLELENLTGSSPLEGEMRALLDKAVREELRRPLPASLKAASKVGFDDYGNTARKAALKSTKRRHERAEREASPPDWNAYNEFVLHTRGSFWRPPFVPGYRLRRKPFHRPRGR
jgi:arylsulfatase A-like enzyme